MKRLILAGLFSGLLLAYPGYNGCCKGRGFDGYGYNHKGSGYSYQGNGSNVPYLKSNYYKYKPSLEIDNENLTIKWVIKANPTDLKILKNHIEFMKERIFEGRTPRGWDKLFVDYAKIRKYLHESIEKTDDSLIVIQQADNKCAFEFAKAHALAVKNDFFNGNTYKNYSNVAIKLENSYECKGILK